MQPPGTRQLHDAPVMASDALATAFPTIHPFAMRVVLAGDEDRRFGVEHAFGDGKEFVADGQGACAQLGVGQVDVAAGEFRCVRISGGVGHVGYSIGSDVDGAQSLSRACRRNSAMRSICCSASANSCAGEWLRRRRHAARMLCRLCPLTARMKGNPNRAS
ncbi:MAG: hypothetical protein BWZ07_01839 [Alphaproteobacteria bacterium ADurb.BinA280]|nr:MAG: hypothetical protein BWZ07_01839 [Alphaproteobacteria bacterium ADurb.BinA280]